MIARCMNEHFYDIKKNRYCPICGARAINDNEIPETEKALIPIDSHEHEIKKEQNQRLLRSHSINDVVKIEFKIGGYPVGDEITSMQKNEYGAIVELIHPSFRYEGKKCIYHDRMECRPPYTGNQTATDRNGAVDITFSENKCDKLRGREGWPPINPASQKPSVNFPISNGLTSTEQWSATRFQTESTEKRQFSKEAWDIMLYLLEQNLNVYDWDAIYDEPEILDGTQWEFIITFSDQERVEYFGSNAFPYNFSDLEQWVEGVRSTFRMCAFCGHWRSTVR